MASGTWRKLLDGATVEAGPGLPQKWVRIPLSMRQIWQRNAIPMQMVVPAAGPPKTASRASIECALPPTSKEKQETGKGWAP